MSSWRVRRIHTRLSARPPSLCEVRAVTNRLSVTRSSADRDDASKKYQEANPPCLYSHDCENSQGFGLACTVSHTYIWGNVCFARSSSTVCLSTFASAPCKCNRPHTNSTRRESRIAKERDRIKISTGDGGKTMSFQMSLRKRWGYNTFALTNSSIKSCCEKSWIRIRLRAKGLCHRKMLRYCTVCERDYLKEDLLCALNSFTAKRSDRGDSLRVGIPNTKQKASESVATHQAIRPDSSHRKVLASAWLQRLRRTTRARFPRHS